MSEPRYRVIERLEAGGMAEVFVGELTGAQGFKKKVAIKRVLPHLAQNKRFISMFLDEARLGARLNHANIVTVIDIGAADNTYFIVMEFVDGANLKNIMDSVRKQGRHFPVKEAIYIVIECLRGLSYAHELTDDDGNALHVVHRDISPPNIMITKRGEVKVTDFGLAKASTQLEKTDPGVVKGKFSYLSPEAALGQEVDARADIFAMGIVLWEMLAGRRLFLGDTDFQTVKLVQETRIPSLGTLNSEVDAEFEAVLHKALTRDAKDRYASAHEFGDALAAYLFRHGMKVTGFDIATLVRDVVALDQKAPQKGHASIIDRLIQEELLRFTSLDELSDPLNPGSRPLSPDDVSDGSKPLDTSAFERPDKWFADDEEVGAAVSGAAARARGQSPLPGPKPTDKASTIEPDQDLAPLLEADSGPISVPPSVVADARQRRSPISGKPTQRPPIRQDGLKLDERSEVLGSPSVPASGNRKGSATWIVVGLALVAAAGVAAWFTGLIPH